MRKNSWLRRRIDHQVVVVSVGASIAATLAALVVSVWGFGQLRDVAVSRQVEAAEVQIANQTEATLRLVTAQSDAVQAKVDSDLKVAHHILDMAGGATFSDDRLVRWDAINQFTKETSVQQLPAMSAGDVWLGQYRDPESRVPVVDEIQGMVGGTTTIFQRMNEEGDMLRVATNVMKLDGQRAIGTYIPAVNPDNTSNAVVSTVLKGETFRGIAYVVNAWYVTAYEPIFDAAGEVKGILYVGVKQESIPSMRTAIENTKTMTNGVVAILGATGGDAGWTIISSDFEEGVPLGQTDAGQPDWLQPLLDETIAADGAVVTGPQVDLPGLGNSALYAAYFAPWDWIVLSATPLDDVLTVSESLASESNRLIQTSLIIGVGVLALVALISAWLSSQITMRIRDHAEVTGLSVRSIGSAAEALSSTVGRATEAAEAMSATSVQVAGSVDDVAASNRELSESFADVSAGATGMGDISVRAVEAVDEATDTIDRLNSSLVEIERATRLIGDIAVQTNLLALNATIEAMAAGEAGNGFAIVAHEVKDLAASTANATAEINKQIEEIQSDAMSAKGVMGRIAVITGELTDVQSTLAAAVTQQQAKSVEITRSITSAASGAADIAKRARVVADGSRSAVAAVNDAEGCVHQLEEILDELRSSIGSETSNGDGLQVKGEDKDLVEV